MQLNPERRNSLHESIIEASRGTGTGQRFTLDTNLIDYLCQGTVGHGNACDSPGFINAVRQRRELERKAMQYWLAWLKSAAYAQRSMQREAKASKASKVRTAKPDLARADYQTEFRAFQEREYGEFWRNALTLTAHDRTAATIKQLVKWATKRQCQLSRRRGLRLGDVAIDFGQANAADKLIRLFAHNGQAKIEARGKALPYFAAKWFARGVRQGQGLGHSEVASWLLEDDVSESKAMDLDLEGTEQTVKDIRARQQALARQLMRQGELNTGPRASAQRRAGRLAWLLAKGERLSDRMAQLAGYHDLRTALDTLQKSGLANGNILRQGQTEIESDCQNVWRTGQTFTEREKAIARNSRRAVAKLVCQDDSAKLASYWLSLRPLNAQWTLTAKIVQEPDKTAPAYRYATAKAKRYIGCNGIRYGKAWLASLNRRLWLVHQTGKVFLSPFSR